jgi:transposase
MRVEVIVKDVVQIVKILEAFDLMRSFRGAAKVAGCDHHTVKRLVALRDAGALSLERPVTRGKLTDAFLEHIEGWMEQSQGRVRADVCFEKLLALGFSGSARTSRRAVAIARRLYRLGRVRVFRPWLPEPGLWLQFDWAKGPPILGRATNLFCAWLAWSRYRLVFPTWDRTLGSLVLCLDQAFRRLGGVPTYVLTDNERSVTDAFVAGIPVRNARLLEAAAHYGVVVHTCVVADPESKGGSEATVRVASADLLPSMANLLGEYDSFGVLEDACEAFMERVNGRPHGVTGRPPVELLAQERPRLHAVAKSVFALALGEERSVSKDALVQHQAVRYSVPSELAQARARLLLREHGEQIIITHVAEGAAREVARHQRGQPGETVIDPSHYPPTPPGPIERQPRAQTELERAFLALGQGARDWLIKAAGNGVAGIHARMQAALDLRAFHDASALDAALRLAAASERFASEDLTSILAYQAAAAPGAHRSSFDEPSLQASTSVWNGFRS